MKYNNKKSATDKHNLLKYSTANLFKVHQQSVLSVHAEKQICTSFPFQITHQIPACQSLYPHYLKMTEDRHINL